MATFRVYKESGNFVTVHKDFIHDDNISWKAKGILLYLLSRPDDWQIYETELINHTSDGRDSLRTGIKELEKVGYIKRERKRDKNGQLREYEYMVYEHSDHIGNSYVGKTYVGETYVGKSNTTNNDSTNNDSTNNDSNTSATKVTQEQFDQWWNLYDKKLDKKKAFSLFKSALKEHDFETIMNGTKDYLKTITDKQYQKHPKTFLNNESYLNDYSKEIPNDNKNKGNSYFEQLMNEEA
ncbi:helix-turn-helix domain-containing protein [Staphylococcus kloosii]|uniref:helix-turn-helix domain-containing protein n=1 Tax=Staphylococcus kloosii TaxID=29384 RepID=UPI001F5440D5|nr:helix-turn-helix domain-containing protein [Staphylococcus kloosii]